MVNSVTKQLAACLLTAALWNACSSTTTAGRHTRPDESRGAVLTVEDSSLTQAALQYLALPKEATATEFAQKRADFELALSEYLSNKNTRLPDKLLLHRDGLTLVFPLRIVQANTGGPAVSSDKRPPPHFSIVAPPLQGEVLDLALVSESGSSQKDLFILFSDSLLAMRWPGFPQAKFERLWFHPMDRAENRPSRGRGVLAQTEGNPGMHPTLLTTSLKSALVLGRDKHTLRTLRPYRGDADLASPLNWRRSDDGTLFQTGDATSFLSLRSMPNHDAYALLDDRGFLKLFRQNLETPVWRSRRAWGSSLFVLGNKTLAVRDDKGQNFVLFERDGSTLIPVATTPPMPGRVTAVTRTKLKKTKGFVVAVQKTGGRESTLHFIPENDFTSHRSDTFPQAELRASEATFSFAPAANSAAQSSGSRTLGETVRPLLYETLFRPGEDGPPVPNLAETVSSDARAHTWEIQLRPDIRFSDGSLLTARDVVQSWRRNWLTCQRNHCVNKWLWRDVAGAEAFVNGLSADIKGLTAKGPTTLVVTLTKTRPRFVQHLSHPCFEVRKDDRKGVVGTGPFAINENVQNTSFQRNTWYHAGSASLREIRLPSGKINPIDFLSTGGLKGAVVQRPKDVAYVKKLGSFDLAAFPKKTLYYLALNPAVQPLADSLLRQYIVSTVLRRDVMASIITESEAQAATAFFGGVAIDVDTPATYTGATGRPLLISYKARDAVAAQIARRLVARLNQLGIKSRSQKLTDTACATLVQSGGYDIIVDAIAPDYSNPLYNLAQLVNNGYIVSAGVRERLHRALAEPPAQGPTEIERELVRAALLYPVVRTQKYAVFPKKLVDWRVTGAETVDLSRAWTARRD